MIGALTAGAGEAFSLLMIVVGGAIIFWSFYAMFLWCIAAFRAFFIWLGSLQLPKRMKADYCYRRSYYGKQAVKEDFKRW